ncbi:MAG: folate-binding protein YgfZ, partial [Gammaproteobacteria bacterium]|nr:folate-binding protein YgfZ [Gammaproteobacteria bacterium]
QEHLHYAVPQSIAETSLAQLKHYALFSKVSFAESGFSSIGIVGEDARALLSQHFILPKQADECVGQGPLLIIQARGLPERFEIIGPIEELKAITTRLGLEPLQDNVLWQKLDIEAGQAFLSPEAIGKFLPHDIRLPELNGVSFSKGCYIGQEIIARMQYLGKLKKQLCLMQLNTTIEPKAGLKILNANQQTQAEIICQALITPGKYVALAVFNQAPQDSEYSLEQNQGQARFCQTF